MSVLGGSVLGSFPYNYDGLRMPNTQLVVKLYNYYNDLNHCGDCSLFRRFYSPNVRKSEIEGSSFRRFVSPKVRKSDNDIDSFLF